MNSEKSTQPSPHKITLKPAKGWAALNLSELWQYHEVIYLLTWRDIKVRYKQAALGLIWVVLQPLLSVLILTVIFGHLAKLPSDGVPYPLFALAGLLAWQLFHNGVQRAGLSLMGNSNLLTRVYFPRLSIPLAAVLSTVVDFFFAFIAFLGLMVYLDRIPGWPIVWVPVLVVLTSVISLSVGLWLSVLNVQYRDVQYAIPFLLQAWMLASPVAYSTQMIPPGKWQLLYGLNPMSGIIQGFRWALVGGSAPGQMFGVSLGVSLLLLITGLFYFRRIERDFADLV